MVRTRGAVGNVGTGYNNVNISINGGRPGSAALSMKARLSPIHEHEGHGAKIEARVSTVLIGA